MQARHILIVDDAADARTLLRLILTTKGGYTTTEATSGAEALAQIRRQRPDAIILDYMMPDMDGLEVCRRLRAMPDLRDLPILMLTAQPNPALREQALAAGVTSFMTKPAAPADLLAEIRRLTTVTASAQTGG